MADLTKRQQEIFNHIREFIDQNKYPPSVRDIADHFSLASSGGVHKHLKTLERKGVIALNKNTSRSIRIIDNDKFVAPPPIGGTSSLHVPLKGYVAAGFPIEGRIDNEHIPYPTEMIRYPDKTYALRVKGTSMIEECINDGDYVIIEDRSIASNGEIVVAMINHTEATLKKFYHEGDRIRLQPANHTMDPIYVTPEKVTIQGVVIGIIRKYF